MATSTDRFATSTVQGIWKSHGLSPHRWRYFKLSNDPAFAEKLTTIVGLYVEPPAHAVMLSVDEKSQIQALDRTQPGLPMKKGRAGTMTDDYILDIISRRHRRPCFIDQPGRSTDGGVFRQIVDIQGIAGLQMRECIADIQGLRVKLSSFD
ncbi:hypothetical protein BFN67_14255 [Pseudaminobacter manganicus]|uniref:Uncharacterized protein n=1 Tax=Manganibacter manganicus TaxID=1873176 RepID=A0A1V8RTR9_9HYPH|nr:hypothetical protein BFN67_14255 [Pseudaminobacter manganicus]